MLQKNIILILSFIILSLIISLFPPYSWGDEKLRTQNERQIVNYYFRNKIPFKQYDFLFNDIKREFTIGENKIVLERHLILSELIIQLFLALLLSILLQFLYRKYSYKFLQILFPILTIIIGIIIILSGFNLFASWFQPDYSIVENERINIKRIYSSYLENYSLTEIISILNEIDKGYQNNWSYETENFWNESKKLVVLDENSLPKIENYIKKEEGIKSEWNELDFTRRLYKIYKYETEVEFPIYKRYHPPSGYMVDYGLLESDLDILRYNIFIQSKSEILKYLEIKNQYFITYNNYWDNKVPLWKKYSIAIFVFIVLLFSILFHKPIQQKLENI